MADQDMPRQGGLDHGLLRNRTDSFASGRDPQRRPDDQTSRKHFFLFIDE